MKKSGIKKFTGMLAASFVVMLLTGCHGTRDTVAFDVPEEFDTSREYEITFWAKNDTNITQTEIYNQAIADFETLYPNIKVNIRLYTNYGDIYNDVITNIATNTTPNVCITYPDHIATYITGENVVVPLDSLFEDEDYGFGGRKLQYDSVSREEMIPKFMEECVIQGQHYAIPYMRSTEACYVNKTYVEALGYTLPEVLTWDFVWEVSEAAMARDKDGNFLVNGQNVLIPFIYKSTDNMMIQMLKQKGAGYSRATGEILLFNDVTEDLLYTIAEHGKSRAFSTFKISSYPANFLNAGQCIFAVDSTAGATWMGSRAPLRDICGDKVVDFETAVMTVPQFDPENPQMISQGPSICIFNKQDPQEVLASWIFAQYLLTNDVQIAYSETEGYIPVTSRAHGDASYQEYLAAEGEDDKTHYEVKIKAAKLLLDNIEHTFVTPVFNGSASLRDASGQLIENTVKAVRRKQTVDQAFMEKLYSDVISLYRLELEGTGISEKEDLGPLPGTAKALLAALGTVWLLILAYLVAEQIKKRKK
ncbi:MAG: ABC transporter substrate-binding protein [Acetatifactor sp.]